MRTAIYTASLSRDARQAFTLARSAGVHGVQLAVVRTELDPASLSQSGRAELNATLGAMGLEIAAICGDVGGLQDPAKVDEHVHRTLGILDLARDLRAPVVTARVGRIPGDRESAVYGTLRSALRELGEYAASRDVVYAIETVADEAATIVNAIDDAQSAGLAINFNPGERRRHELEPMEGWDALRKRIVHVQATDAFAEANTDDAEPELGKGDAELDECVAALRENGYEGFLTMRFRSGPGAEARAARGVAFLTRHGGVRAPIRVHTASKPSVTLG